MSETYRDSSSSAAENKSSGIVLVAVGVAGVVFVVLGMVKIIPFKFSNPYLFYGILMALFALFLVMGFVSLVNARKYGKMAKSESGVKDSLIKWSSENISAEKVDAFLSDCELMTEEEKYFGRCEVIGNILNKQFLNLNPEMLDDLIDKKIYGIIFGENA